MELGTVHNLEQFNVNSFDKSQVIDKTSQIQKINNEKDSDVSIVDEFLKLSETQEKAKVAKSSSHQEVVLTNLNFGFNDSSRDFFVKAVHGEVENQYPTDDMMRLKAYMMAQNSN